MRGRVSEGASIAIQTVALMLGAVTMMIAPPAWPFTTSAAPAVAPLPAEAARRPIRVSKLIVDVPKGEQIGTLSTGPILCIPRARNAWNGPSGELKPDAIQAVFNDEATRAGFRAVGDPTNMFETSTPGDAADFEIGAEITAVRQDVCYPMADPGSNILNDYSLIKGSMQIDIEWQVFSRLEQKVVARVRTTGGFRQARAIKDGDAAMLSNALDGNVRELLNSPAFRNAVTAPAPSAGELLRPQSLEPLTLTGSGADLSVADSVGSVVAIFAGDGFGSGFVVGDGYLVTNRHVVGDAATVKVRWPDGLEFSGSVVRRDGRRDVALIRSDTRGRPPLAVRSDPLRPGDTVFAIGTPLDPRLQNTVTRGVVSAMRTIDGFAFIQSDVSINHGNSGGPLLDEKGRVVGVAVLALQPSEDTPAGINFFIPIRDALDFLAVKITDCRASNASPGGALTAKGSIDPRSACGDARDMRAAGSSAKPAPPPAAVIASASPASPPPPPPPAPTPSTPASPPADQAPASTRSD